MEKEKFVWNLTHNKKIKVKEIREHNIVWNEEYKVFDVIVYGFFGGGVAIFQSDSEITCRNYVDEMTK